MPRHNSDVFGHPCLPLRARSSANQRLTDEEDGVYSRENQDMLDEGNTQQLHGGTRKLGAVMAPTRGVQCV